jgi:hypothetical protein
LHNGSSDGSGCDTGSSKGEQQTRRIYSRTRQERQNNMKEEQETKKKDSRRNKLQIHEGTILPGPNG